MPIYDMPDSLKDAVHQAWLRPPAAVITSLRPRAEVVIRAPEKHDAEPHFWHASGSSSTSESAAVSAAWAGIVLISPSGVVSNTLKVRLEPYTHPAYRSA